MTCQLPLIAESPKFLYEESISQASVILQFFIVFVSTVSLGALILASHFFFHGTPCFPLNHIGKKIFRAEDPDCRVLERGAHSPGSRPQHHTT